MLVRAMRQEDIPACRFIIAECWSTFTAQLAEPELMEMFNGGAWRPHFYVAEGDGLLGLAGYNTSWLTYGVYNLFWVAVRPAVQRQGTATKLVQRCLDDLLPVADGIMLVTGVPQLYKRFGFRTIDRVPSQESFGDCLMLKKREAVQHG